jgi:hypothetical protein
MAYRKAIMEQREEERRKQEERDEEKRREMIEEQHKRDLMNSCPPDKVRTYACDSTGMRTIKYFSYQYDFNVKKCLEKERKKRVQCRYDAYAQVEQESEEEEVAPSHGFIASKVQQQLSE